MPNESIKIEYRAVNNKKSAIEPVNDKIFYRIPVAIRKTNESLISVITPIKCPFPNICFEAEDYSIKWRVIECINNSIKIGVIGDYDGIATMYLTLFYAPEIVTDQ
jgi:hypothetical protein